MYHKSVDVTEKKGNLPEQAIETDTVSKNKDVVSTSTEETLEDLDVKEEDLNEKELVIDSKEIHNFALLVLAEGLRRKNVLIEQLFLTRIKSKAENLYSSEEIDANIIRSISSQYLAVLQSEREKS